MKFTLERLLQQQGFGSRKEARALIRHGRVQIDGEIHDHPFEEFDPSHLPERLVVDEEEWPVVASLTLILHKPAGYECSRNPLHHPSIYSLLPEHFVRRGVQSIGRLDEDTTGLLILTENGQLNHRLSSPKGKVPKTYRVGLRHAIDDAQLSRLRSGVLLHDENQPLIPAALEPTGSHELLLTITEGKYHQVKRMMAAAGNRVESLARLRVGALDLPPDLPPGEWRLLTPENQSLLMEPTLPAC